VNTQDNRIRGQQYFAIEDIPKGARHLVGDHFACRRLFSSAIIDIRGKRHGCLPRKPHVLAKRRRRRQIRRRSTVSVGRTMPGCPVGASREPLTHNAKDLHARSEAEVQSKRTSLGDDFRPVDIGVRRMSAMQTTEFGLGFAVAAIGKTAHLALLRSVSRIVLNGSDAEPVFEVSKLRLEHRSTAVGNDAVQATGQAPASGSPAARHQFPSARGCPPGG